jgi:hypothetical protein
MVDLYRSTSNCVLVSRDLAMIKLKPLLALLSGVVGSRPLCCSSPCLTISAPGTCACCDAYTTTRMSDVFATNRDASLLLRSGYKGQASVCTMAESLGR